MRLDFRGALILAAGYLMLMAAFAVGLERSLRSLEEQLGGEMVRLLAREQANLVLERSIETLQFPDPGSRRRLQQRIQDLTLLSEVVTSLALVDRDGRLVASDVEAGGTRFVAPAALFGNPPLARLEPGGRRSFLSGGDYVVLLPVVEEGVCVGYFRIGLHSDRVAALYQQSWWRFVGLGLLALAAVAGLGAFLQVQLARRTASLAAALEGTSPPRAARGPTDPFARVLLRASRMRDDLDAARRQSERRGLQVGALTRRLKVGAILLGHELDVEHVSARALELLGCSDEDAFRKTWESQRAVVREALVGPPTSPEGGCSVTLDVASGRKVRAELHRLEGVGGGLLALLSDPRALDALETDARVARQLESLGRVYRTLAHELRAPLSAIMINLDLLSESLAAADAQGPRPEQRERERRHVGVLRDELSRLNRSLYAILTQATPEEPAREFDLLASLGDLADLLRAQARRQGVELETRFDGSGLTVRGFPDRLRQAFLNVAVNALEAMPGGGRLTVEACRDGAWAKVAVRDTGPGIEPQMLGRLCEPDFSTKEGGSGIGLWVARALVELHGGEIRVESDVTQGTAVRVSLPLAGGGN